MKIQSSKTPWAALFVIFFCVALCVEAATGQCDDPTPTPADVGAGGRCQGAHVVNKQIASQ
jgi:hypothetical protein